MVKKEINFLACIARINVNFNRSLNFISFAYIFSKQFINDLCTLFQTFFLIQRNIFVAPNNFIFVLFEIPGISNTVIFIPNNDINFCPM